MVVERRKVAPRIRKKSAVEQALNNFALCAQAFLCQIHKIVEARKKLFFAFCQIADLRQVNRNDTQRAGKFIRAEKTAAAFSQFALVKLQAAAHRAHVARIQVGIDEILKIRRSVLGSHFEQKLCVFSVPVKILGNVVGGNRVLKAAASRIACDHKFDKNLIDKVHFFLAVAVGKLGFLAADHGLFGAHVFGHRPIERNVRKGRLASPAAGRIDAVDKTLNALAHVFFAHIVFFDKGSQVRIEGAERLCAGPFILHNA